MSDEGFSALRVQLQRLRKLSDEITRVLLSGEEIIRNYDSLRYSDRIYDKILSSSP